MILYDKSYYSDNSFGLPLDGLMVSSPYDSMVIGNQPYDSMVIGNQSYDSMVIGNSPYDSMVIGNQPYDSIGNQPYGISFDNSMIVQSNLEPLGCPFFGCIYYEDTWTRDLNGTRKYITDIIRVILETLSPVEREKFIKKFPNIVNTVPNYYDIDWYTAILYASTLDTSLSVDLSFIGPDNKKGQIAKIIYDMGLYKKLKLLPEDLKSIKAMFEQKKIRKEIIGMFIDDEFINNTHASMYKYFSENKHDNDFAKLINAACDKKRKYARIKKI